ncbi:carbohydrate ABC transporter permease [Poseidonocella sp. HB161398]|uniref:carbohydrate ABC transporter permease n=1 Tax=Poseidonocella sp. HB161398 TaxID=2320855 RepID=UPI001980E768|nr:sugar ABC transporter permease [Poseidonocella sp. HB161398]
MSCANSSGGLGAMARTAAAEPARRRPLPDWGAAMVLLAPMALFFGVSVLYPLADTVRLSFHELRGLGGASWVGLGNYAALAQDPVFLATLWRTLAFTLSVTAISVGIGWTVGLLCAFAPRQTAPFRLMIFATFGISEAVSGFIWIGIFRPDSSGLLNGLLGLAGLGELAQPWLGSPGTAMAALIAAASWSAVGLPLLLTFAAVQTIPKSVLEAAYIDGAKPLATMWHIMMPLSLPGVRVAVFINLVTALRAFDIIFVLTGGGPARSTETVGFFMYRVSMTEFNLGYGAATTVVLLLAVMAVSLPAVIQRTKGAR